MTSPFRDVVGDMSFSGGFEKPASGGDTQDWMEMVTKDSLLHFIFSLTTNDQLRMRALSRGDT